MQTGTKKTPDRFQNYFCPAAANDIVHHAHQDRGQQAK